MWHIWSDGALWRYFWNWGPSGHCADCREVCGRDLVTPRFSAAARAIDRAAWRCWRRCPAHSTDRPGGLPLSAPIWSLPARCARPNLVSTGARPGALTRPRGGGGQRFSRSCSLAKCAVAVFRDRSKQAIFVTRSGCLSYVTVLVQLLHDRIPRSGLCLRRQIGRSSHL